MIKLKCEMSWGRMGYLQNGPEMTDLSVHMQTVSR